MSGFEPKDAVPADSIDHVDIDPQTGQSVGSNLNPDDTPPPPPPPEKVPAHEKQNVRNDIYSSARDNRAALVRGREDSDETSKIMARRMEYESAGMSAEEQQEKLAEEFGDLTGSAEVLNAVHGPSQEEIDAAKRIAAAADPDAVHIPESAKEVDDQGQQWVRIKVDSQEQYATVAEVEEAGGVEALQKSRAADLRLQDQAIQAAALRAQEAELAERARELEQREAALSTQAAPPSPGGPPAGSEEDLNRRVEDLTDRLLSGDEARTREAVRELLSPQRPQTSTTADPKATATAAAPGPGAQAPATTQAAPSLPKAQIEANAHFRAKFGEILADKPAEMGYVRDRIRYLSAMEENRGKPLTQLVDEAATYVIRTYLPPQGVSVLPAEEVRKRISAKRRTPGPSRATQAAPGSQGKEPELTREQKRKQAIEQSRKERGQPV